jgi:hypothetical protein
MLQPGINCLERLWIELVITVAASPVFPNQVGAAKLAQVLGNGRP